MLTQPPHRLNRTKDVKYAFTRIFNPNWADDQLSFIKEKVEIFNYLITLKKTFKFSLCSRCNSTLSRLILRSKSSKLVTEVEIDESEPSSLQVSQDIEVCDLTIAEDETNLSETFESDESNEIDTYSTDENVEYKFHYGVFIKLDGKFQPAKWYTIIVSEVDELLAEIHTNVVTLTKDESIEACDYHIAFKGEKAKGAGTQLADAQDFQKFCLDYQKLSTKNTNMDIFIIINSQNSNKTKRKRKNNNSETEIEDNSTESTEVHKNKNRIPNISNLTSEETQMAKNVLEIHTANYCNIHNRACLNKDSGKETLSQSYSSSHNSEQALQVSNLIIPTIEDFLKQVDESEDTGEYY
ncbi:10973_t:CDS:2 [Racocetra fulgida]|uniref:10973_t:CDS:1 n=1 Tax=Racocetra fulgida TaxID=60492 RepID=A0A9N9GIH5_9GLOM|nr:10973_t:CDS:2 [Racocetra fulgida]